MRPSRPLVSIVIPVKNGGDWLAEAIDSALAQTYPEIEVVVVDDGSDDDGHTANVIASYGDQVVAIHQQNQGVAGALNTGIARMRGAYLSWLSHDDRYLPHKVEKQLHALQRLEEPAIAFGDALMIDEGGARQDPILLASSADPADHSMWHVLEGRISGCTLLVPRECFDACGGFDPGLPTTQDYHLWFRMAQRFRFVPVPEALVETRVHAQQGSRIHRHLDEAGLLWSEMLESMPSELRARMASSDAALLARMSRAAPTRTYPGAAATVARLAAGERAQQRLTVLVEADDPHLGQTARAALVVAGYAEPDLVFVERSRQTDAERLGVLHPRLRHLGRLLSFDPDDSPATLLRHALAIGGEALVYLHDHRCPADGERLRRLVDPLIEGAADASVAPAGNASCFGALGRAVVRRSTLEAAVDAVLIDGPAGVLNAMRRGGARIGTFGAAAAAETDAMTRPGHPPPRAGGGMNASGMSPEPTAGPRPMLLILQWQRTESTSRHASALSRFVSPAADVLTGWMSSDTLVLSAASSDEHPIAGFSLPGEILAAARFLREHGLTRIHVLRAGPADERIDVLLDALRVPMDATLFDHALVARHPNLLDENGRFPGEGAARRLLRRRPELFAARAERIFATSRDLARRMDTLVPGLEPAAALPPASTAPDSFRVTASAIAQDARIDIVLLGDLTPERGRNMVLELAELVERDGHPITLTLLGRVVPRIDPNRRRSAALTLAGPAPALDLTAALIGLRPHLAWFPHRAPLSRDPGVDDALLNGLPVLATAIGDLPERLGRRPCSWLLPPETDAAGWLEILLRLRHDGLAGSDEGSRGAEPADVVHDRERFLAPI